MEVAPDRPLSQEKQQLFYNHKQKQIDSTALTVCTDIGNEDFKTFNILVSVATQLPEIQFLVVNTSEKNSFTNFAIDLKLPTNLFIGNLDDVIGNFISCISLWVVLIKDSEGQDLYFDLIKTQIPVFYFDDAIEKAKVLEDNRSYVFSGEASPELLLLSIKRFFEQNDDNIHNDNKKIISFDAATSGSDSPIITPQTTMIEEQTKVEIDYAAQGAKLQEQGDLEGAITSYQKAIERDRNCSSWIYCSLLACLNLSGQYEEGISVGEQAILVYPATGDLHRSLGLLYDQKQDVDKVIEHYIQAINCDLMQPPWLYCALIELLTLQKHFDKAEKISCQGLEVHPNEPDIYHHYGILLYKINDFKSAIDKLQKSIALNPNHFWSNNILGEILLQNQRWQESSYFLQQATKLNQDYLWSYYNLGESLFKEGKWQDAIASYEKFLEFKPDTAEVRDKINTALDNLVSLTPQKNESEYLAEIEQNPSNIELQIGLANIYMKQSRLSKAIALLQTVLDFAPKRSDVEFLLERALERRRKLYRAYKHKAEEELYGLWLKENLPQASELDWMPEIVQTLGYKPTISIIVPTYNPPEHFLREMIESVLNQVYPYWELCIADDASPQPHVKSTLEEYASKYDNIKVIYREDNGHISAASNSALELAIGEFITLLDHDDLLTPDALYQVVLLLNKHPNADMIYSDEDKINERDRLQDPYFKPDWCPDSFLARNYICHLGTYRRQIIKNIGSFRLGYEGSQDYDLVLRFTEKSNNIFHIPKVLYHWRIHSNSAATGSEAKPYAYDAGTKALEDALMRRNEPGRVINNEQLPGIYTIRYEIKEYKLVSIVIPNRNLGDVLERCLESIFTKSTYPNFEVIIVDNGSDEQETLDMFKRWQEREPQRFSVHRLGIPFNYSRLNNFGVSYAKGDYLLFLNNDTEVITPDWIEAMVEQTQRESVGVVGAKLLYPDDTIQHAGVVLGLGGVAGHSHKHFPKDHIGYVRQLWSTNNYSAVTAACVMCRRKTLEEVEGFDETLKVAFNDVDFCLKIKDKGYNNLCLPHVMLYHYESKSRGYEDTPEKQKRFLGEIDRITKKWGNIIANDPCYSPNLTRNQENYSINIKTQVTISDVIAEPNNPEKLYGFHLDTPQPHDRHIGVLTISGWALGHHSPISQIQIFSEQKFITSAYPANPRVDVHQVFPLVPESDICGFKLSLELVDMLAEKQLSVRALHQDRSCTPLGTIYLSH